MKMIKSLLLRAALYAALLVAVRAALPDRAYIPADAPGLSRALPVLMYHSVLRDETKQGKYVVTPDTLYADLRYLKEKGYTAVLPEELIAFVKGTAGLPLKPVLITFDDGYYNNLTYVLPILEALEMKAAISIVGRYAELYSASPDPNPNYAHLSFEEIEYLAASGRVEICNHSFDMHSLGARQGSGRKKGESDARYQRAFTADTEKCQQLLADNCGLSPTVYTYPYGVIGAGTRAYLERMGFCASLSCFEQGNTITRGEPDSLWCLGRFNRPAGESTEAFMARALGE